MRWIVLLLCVASHAAPTALVPEGTVPSEADKGIPNAEPVVPATTDSAKQELPAALPSDSSPALALSTVQVPPPAEMTIQKFYHRANKEPSPSHITLTIQSDIGRIQRGAVHAEAWKGPISYALLVKPGQEKQVDEWLSKQKAKGSRVADNVNIHLCVTEDDFEHYPINKMRNNAIEGSQTDLVYVLDIDEYAVGSMDYHLQTVESTRMEDTSANKPAFVVAAWQWAGSKHEAPKNKDQLRELEKKGVVAVKSPGFTKAYTPPGMTMSEWLDIDHSRRVQFKDSYEPYYIARKSQLPPFDPRFIGWGRNKAIQTLTMAAEGFSFIVLPNVYSFADEEPKESHAAPADGEFLKQAYKEFGASHGCSSCGEWDCVEKCPGMFKNAA